jgi:hypothetical protein
VARRFDKVIKKITWTYYNMFCELVSYGLGLLVTRFCIRNVLTVEFISHQKFSRLLCGRSSVTGAISELDLTRRPKYVEAI